MVFPVAGVFAEHGEPCCRAAEAGEIAGLWEQVAVKPGTVGDVSNSWFSAPQVYRFTEDGYMKKLIDRGGEIMADDLARLDSAPKSTEYEAVDADGLMEVRYPEGTTYNVLCTYCTEGAEAGGGSVRKEGDMILSYMEEGGDEAMFYRLLRRRGEEDFSE